MKEPIKHTPGPWVYDPERDMHDYCIHKAGAREEEGQIVHEDGVIGSSEWIWIKNANAGLIVEAPDMYNLISKIANCDFCLDEKDRDIIKEQAIRILEAIRNERGET